jgi:hypothetical protein
MINTQQQIGMTTQKIMMMAIAPAALPLLLHSLSSVRSRAQLLSPPTVQASVPESSQKAQLDLSVPTSKQEEQVDDGLLLEPPTQPH